MTNTTEEEINNLLKKRESFITIKANLAKLIEPKIFQLEIENIVNVRNTIVICGVLATVALTVLNNSDFAYLDSVESFFELSTFSFLIAIFFYSFFLKEFLSKGRDELRNKIASGLKTSEEAVSIINKGLDGEKNYTQIEEELKEVYRDIEFVHVRGKNSDKSHKKFDLLSNKLINMSAYSGNFFFILGILSLVAGMVVLMFI